MHMPDVTRVQQGAGALYATVALACMAQSVRGLDLIAYLVSAAAVSAAAMYCDKGIRKGRASIVEASQYASVADDDEA